MLNIMALRAHDRITANYRQTRQRIAHVKSVGIHSEKVMRERAFFEFIRRSVDAILAFFRRMFGGNHASINHPYVYTGPHRPPTPKALRFEVYQRRNGRKYNRACV